MPVAYAPAAGFTAENCGTIALGDSDLDVRAALDEGDGYIVVPDEDTLTIARLDDYVALKRTSVPKAKKDEPKAEAKKDAPTSDKKD